MTGASGRAHERETEDALVARRATLTAEERAAGSDDPMAQAEVILEESEARARDRDRAPTTTGEHRRSEDTVEPPAAPDETSSRTSGTTTRAKGRLS